MEQVFSKSKEISNEKLYLVREINSINLHSTRTISFKWPPTVSLREHVTPKQASSHSRSPSSFQRGTDHLDFRAGQAQVSLQAVLDHTAIRLLQLKHEVLTSLGLSLELTLICKWGMDGSSEQSISKQRTVLEETDESLFVTSLVPLRLVASNGQVVWSNRTPRSPRFWRPLRLQFKKEAAALIREEETFWKHQIRKLEAVCQHDVKVHNELHLTMIDGKVANALSNTRSQQTCNLCGANPRDMNDLEMVSARSVQHEVTQYGLSPLHAWIRCFEALLKISYRLSLRIWQVRRPEDKEIVSQKKRRIQKRFKNDFGLHVRT